MYQTQTLSSFTSWTVSSVPESEGVYELFDSGKSLIYIGRSDSLRRRLTEHLNTSDNCIKSAAYFSYEVTSSSISREQELLAEYKRIHGRYPRCNEKLG
jgi:excinuclease UvrABC nuclease subunit